MIQLRGWFPKSSKMWRIRGDELHQLAATTRKYHARAEAEGNDYEKQVCRERLAVMTRWLHAAG